MDWNLPDHPLSLDLPNIPLGEIWQMDDDDLSRNPYDDDPMLRSRANSFDLLDFVNDDVDDPAIRSPSRRDSPARFDDLDEHQEIPVEKEKTRKRKRKGSESWGAGHLPPAVPRDQLQNCHYGDRMHHWQPDLDGFQRIARRSGRKTLAENLVRANQIDAALRARLLEERLFAAHFRLPLDTDALVAEMHLPKDEIENLNDAYAKREKQYEMFEIQLRPLQLLRCKRKKTESETGAEEPEKFREDHDYLPKKAKVEKSKPKTDNVAVGNIEYIGPGDDPDYRAKNSAILKENLRRRGFEGPIREHRPWHDGINTFISPKFAKIQKTLDIPEEKKWAIFEDTLLAHQKKIDFDEKGLAAKLGIPEAKVKALRSNYYKSEGLAQRGSQPANSIRTVAINPAFSRNDGNYMGQLRKNMLRAHEVMDFNEFQKTQQCVTFLIRYPRMFAKGWQASNEMGWTSNRGPGDCRTHGLLERTSIPLFF
ncbi:unnamed protein product, partial [Mesorhabditis spiculigera]